MLITSTACSFSPLATTPGPSEGADAQDTGTGGFDGGIFLDAAPQPDAALPDGTVRNDAGFPDAGTADATPNPDAGPGQDAGFVDTGVNTDAGIGDAGCGMSLPTSPAQIGSLPLPHAIDVPILWFDADGDGTEEIIVASSSQNDLSVISYDTCGQATVTTNPSAPLGPGGPIGIFVLGQPAIVTQSGGSVRVFRYDSQANPPTLTEEMSSRRDLGSNIDFMLADPSGTIVLATGRSGGNDTAWFIDSGWSSSSDMLSAPVIEHPAFFGPYQSSARFVAGDDRSAIVLTPGQAGEFLGDGMGVTPGSEISLFRASTLTLGTHTFIFYGADESGGGQQIRMAHVNESDPTMQQTDGQSLQSQFLTEPVLLSRAATGSDEFFAFYLRQDGRIHGCEITGGTTLNCTPPAGAVDLGNQNLSANVGLLTGYLNNNSAPDIVVSLAQTGEVQFLTSNLTAAAGSVNLGGAISATPGLSLAFYDRFGENGTMLVVPMQNNTLALVGWATPAQAGPITRLWPQWRHDASRSGSL